MEFVTKLRWAVLGYNYFQERYAALSQFLNDQNCPNELSLMETSPSEFPEALERSTQDFDWIRIERPHGEAVVNAFPHVGMDMLALKSADGVFFKGDRWWPKNGYVSIFNDLISAYGERMDLGGEILVVGAQAEARAAIASVMRAGFKKINLTCRFDDEGINLIADLKKAYLGVEFQFIPQDHLVLLPGMNILAINTVPLSTENQEFLNELSYLNFLRPDGMIWELVVKPIQTALLKEASQINVTCVAGFEIAARVDEFWLRTLGRPIDREALSFHYLQSFSD